jgi:hypothetical protein
MRDINLKVPKKGQTNMDKAPLIAHWVKSSDIDFKAMEHLFEKRDYTWALFYLSAIWSLRNF